MKVIYNKIIPFKGFVALYFFGVLFVRREYVLTERTMRHETIHHEQAKELLFIGFYLWYMIEWFIRLFINGPGKAYRNISFEREAYGNADDMFYIDGRKRFSFLKYMRNENN